MTGSRGEKSQAWILLTDKRLHRPRCSPHCTSLKGDLQGARRLPHFRFPPTDFPVSTFPPLGSVETRHDAWTQINWLVEARKRLELSQDVFLVSFSTTPRLQSTGSQTNWFRGLRVMMGGPAVGGEKEPARSERDGREISIVRQIPSPPLFATFDVFPSSSASGNARSIN